jgi:uncharacterized protein (TIGR02996 family)
MRKAGSFPESVGLYLDQVLRMSPNPQFAPALVLLSRLPEFEVPLNLTKLCLTLKHVGPPFDVAPLKALQARLATDSDSAARLAFIIRMGSEWVPPVLDVRAEAALEGLREALGARVEQEHRCASVRERWLPQVYAQPDDDAVRLVMADELVALGDPWGEFIVLQCSPAPDEARVAALLEAHRWTWEGPLGTRIKRGRTRFERGFPVSVQLRQGSPALPSFTAPGPAWSTVREVDWGGDEGPGFDAEWFMHPLLRGIRRMSRMDLLSARRMGPHPSVSRLGLCAPQPGRTYLDMVPGVEWAETLERLAQLPSLSWLELRNVGPLDLLQCARSPLAAKLERIDADSPGSWRLTVRPAAEVPIEATLVSEEAVSLFVEVLRAAEGFGTRGLRVRCERKLKSWEMKDLRQATTAYSHVEWE